MGVTYAFVMMLVALIVALFVHLVVDSYRNEGD